MATEGLEGARELAKKLSVMGKKLGGKLLRQATSSAMLPVKKRAKQNIPKGKNPHKTYKGRLVSGGFSSRQIASKSFLSKDKTTAYALVGVKREAFYALHFIELGWQAKTRGKGRKSVGAKAGKLASRPKSTVRQGKKVAGRPWLVPAFKSTKTEALSRLTSQLRSRIEKEAKK